MKQLLNEEIPRHKKKAAHKKPWIIEAYSLIQKIMPGWIYWGKYTTKERAEKAIKDLSKSHARDGWKFRIKCAAVEKEK